MFLLNSCPGLFSAALHKRASLLPKLRDLFAEFLGNASSVGLGILSPSTCVGLRYGYAVNNSGFSRHALCALPYLFFGPYRALGLPGGICLPGASCVCARLSIPRPRFTRASPHVLSHRSTGISTCCPSATAYALALGPDLPRADQLYPGNLGYLAQGIPTPVSLLIPAFSLPACPPSLAVWLLPDGHAPLPCTLSASLASVVCFSPGHFRRRASRPVSCYALFERVAASEPTSWLSLKSHILFHLTRTLGP